MARPWLIRKYPRRREPFFNRYESRPDGWFPEKPAEKVAFRSIGTKK